MGAKASGFYRVAAEHPDRRAMVDPSGREHTSGELAAAANRLARGLRACGLEPGDTVAAVMPNGPELLVLYAATVQTGLVLVIPNWHLNPAEIAVLLEDAESRLVVTHERFAATVRQAADLASVSPAMRFCTSAAAGFRPLDDLSASQSAEPLDDRVGGQIMFFTSGTTGRPKGVRKHLGEVSSEEVCLITGIGVKRAVADGASTDGVSDEVILVSGPLYHAMPIAMSAGALDSGALLVLMDRWTPEGWLDLVDRHRVTSASMVPTMFHRLLALPDEVRLAADVSSLRAITHAGAPCSIELKHRMLDWLGPIITESYSSTEGAGTSVTAEEWLARPGTVGRPSPGVTLKILDEDGRECPAGTPGLVFLSQTLWTFDYNHDAAKTEQSRRDGLFTVGDIGYLDDDGYLFLCDRQAEVIISGGVNIYPAEVEARLLEHPGVGDVAVIGVPDEEWGEAVRGVVEPAAGVAPTPELAAELVVWCREGLAGFKCPRVIDFVDELGRDPNGKVRKAQIRAPYWEGRERRI
jgi:long-chain acyl-CoA synthetase